MEKIEVRTNEIENVLGKQPPGLIRWGMTVMAVVLVTLFLLTYLVAYPDLVSVPMTLSPHLQQSSGINENNLFIHPLDSDVVHSTIILVSPQEVGRVRSGQSVQIKLDRYAFQEYGILSGIVKDVAILPVEGGYPVKIEIPENKSSYGLNLSLLPGMTGTANIITKERSLFDRLFYFKMLPGMSKDK